jgi:phosphoglycolate phosphatase
MWTRGIKLIAFDLDGTLVESAPDLADAINAMLAGLGLEPVDDSQVAQWIGNGADMLVKRALTGEMWPVNEPPLLEQGLPLFQDHYERHICRRSRLFPGVVEGLQQLKSAGFILACITNKHSRYTIPLLEQIGILGYFHDVGCGNQFTKHKPAPEPLLKTAERFAVDTASCLMVGDSANDVLAARAAGYKVLCVPYGYHGGDGVKCLEPDGIIASIADLPDWLK